MKVSELFAGVRPVFSFEVFPPRKTSSIESIYNTLKDLCMLRPDFISVTYGAGGRSGKSVKTYEIASIIKNQYNVEAVAHLTCVNSLKSDIDEEMSKLKENGIENILALRGDINPDCERKYDFMYACDLVKYIREKGDFGIIGACYPEGHVETDSRDTDIMNLKRKVDAGVSHLITQLFFDNDIFYRFIEKIRAAGIDVPVEAGIMPISGKKQIEKIVSMCGASLPPKFVKIMQKYEYNPEALCDAGIAYASEQISDLISNGADGIHLYTMNNPYVAKRISESIG